MGWGVTFTSVVVGFAPVMAPVLSVGNTTWDMNTFHACPALVLGSMFLLEPYHTASARPGPPALIHGKTFTASPVAVDPSLTWTGLVHLVHPVDAAAALTKTWRCEGFVRLLSRTHATNKFRAVSIDATENSTSGESGSPLAIGISLS